MTINHETIKKVKTLDQSTHQKSFGQSLYDVLQTFEIKVELIEKSSGIDRRNIYRYMNEGVIPSKRSLIQLLIGMKVPYQVSIMLLRSAGYTLNSSWADTVYAAILENPNSLDIFEANTMIDEINRCERNAQIPLFKI